MFAIVFVKFYRGCYHFLNPDASIAAVAFKMFPGAPKMLPSCAMCVLAHRSDREEANTTNRRVRFATRALLLKFVSRHFLVQRGLRFLFWIDKRIVRRNARFMSLCTPGARQEWQHVENNSSFLCFVKRFLI